MKYLHFKTTKNLTDLTAPFSFCSFPWERLGSTAKAINASKIDGANRTDAREYEIAYLLPIINEKVTLEFIENLKCYGINAEILTKAEAVKFWKAYKTIKNSRK